MQISSRFTMAIHMFACIDVYKRQVRDRDTMEQERIKIEDLDAYFEKKFTW